MDDNVHRLCQCVDSQECWGWIRRIVCGLVGEIKMSDWEIIHLIFPRSRMDKEITWIVATYVAIVEEERKAGRKLSIPFLLSRLKVEWQKIYKCAIFPLIFCSPYENLSTIVSSTV